MRRRARLAICILAAAAGITGLLAPGVHAADDAHTARSIQLDSEIDPASERWIGAALDSAADDHVPLVIIRIDTPGGLDSSLRAIVKDIINAPMPVVVYVSPDGARAASAGAFISQAADVLAMAPQTNIGSASAVNADGSDIGSTLGRKIENDASAYIRALASSHGRNATLSEDWVRNASNVTATEALKANAIDLIAPDQDALLKDLNGFQVEGPKAQTLDTAGLEIDNRDTPFLYDVLEFIVNPNISYLLLIAGLLGLGLELLSPGLIVPGLFGIISFVLGAYGSAQLSVNAAGVILLIVGIALIVAEAHTGGHGIFGIVGVIALVASGLLLYNDDGTGFGISAALVIGVGVGLGSLFIFIAGKAAEARAMPVASGYEEMVGAEGVVRVALDPVGQIFTRGALWRARAADAGGPEIAKGTRVRVDSVEGLTLEVEPVAEPDE